MAALHPEGDGAWLTASLVDRSTGRQAWGEQYHTETNTSRKQARLDDVARVIAARVGSEEGVLVQMLAGEKTNERPTCRIARCVLAGAMLIKGDVGGARPELDRALDLSPGSLVYLEMIGWLLTLCGEWDRGAGLLQIAKDLNPCCLPHTEFGLWAAHVHSGDIEQAYRAAVDFRDPMFFWRALMRACCLGHLGRTAEAKAEAAELLRRKPDFKARGRILIGRFIKFPELTDRIVEGLALAGLHLDHEHVMQPVA